MEITKEIIAEKNQKRILLRAGNIITKTIRTVTMDEEEKGFADWKTDNPIIPKDERAEKEEMKKEYRKAQKENPILPEWDDDDFESTGSSADWRKINPIVPDDLE